MAQRVWTTWTKRSRGGSEATVRNRVPVVFPVPEGARFHEVKVDESTGFTPQSTVLDALDGVTFREAGGSLAVRVELAPMSWPRREWRPEPVRLRPGEWLRWQINYRFGSTCECGAQWRYRLETLNLAYGTVADFAGRPAHFVDERGVLR